MDQKQRKQRYFDDAFKRMVIAEYLSTGRSKTELEVKYGIARNGGLLSWMRKLGIEDIRGRQNVKFAYSILEPSVNMPEESKSVQELQKEIRQLKRQLEDEKLRSEAYSRIIEIAEKELKIPLKKKPDTK